MFVDELPSLIASAPAAHQADLPWSVHVAAGLALVVGLMIWLVGGRLMRPAFIALGALIGASLAHLIPGGIDRFFGQWAVIGTGTVVGALAGWLAFRVLVANVLALVVAIVSALGVAAFVEAPGTPKESPPVEQSRAEDAPADEPTPAARPKSIEEWILSLQLQRLKDSASSASDELNAAAEDDPPHGSITELTVERGSRAVKAFAARAWRHLVIFWNDDLDPRGRALILLALSLGYLGGLVLGFALPKRAATVTTAMIGPAVWMPAAAYLMVAMGLPIAESIPADPLQWLLAWAAAAVIGAALQLFGGMRSKGVSAPK